MKHLLYHWRRFFVLHPVFNDHYTRLAQRPIIQNSWGHNV
jgi:hypothetical protein